MPSRVSFISRMEKGALGKGIIIFLLVLGSVVFAFPFVWTVSTSLKPVSQLFVWPPVLIPDPILWENYPKALTFIPFGQYALNSVVYSGLNVIGVLISSSLVAFGFTRYDAPGKNILFLILLGTMMVPFYAVMIPLFILFKSLGWINTLKPLIIPAYFGHPFSIFLLRQFFLSIPSDLFDAAAIDGCDEFTAFARIMLPLSKPALATVAIFQFMATWNDFVGPLLYLHTPEKRTLSLGLQAFQSVHDTEWALLMAAAVVMLSPIILLFFFTQKHFIQGIALTGIKG